MIPSIKRERTAKKEVLSKREDKKRINIRWNSGLFFQIGLIVSMLLVFLVVESNLGIAGTQIAFKDNNRTLMDPPNFPYIVDITPPKEVVKPKAPEVKRPVQKPVVTNTFTPVDDKANVIESNTTTTEVDQNTTIDIPVNTTPATPSTEVKNVMNVEVVPIFPGCESLATNAERKACLDEKISAFISRKFNIDKFSDKYAGEKSRIDAQFTVNSNGEIVDVRTKNKYEDLASEAKRVLSSLPKMTPGKQQSKPVNVIYTIPIVLKIDY
ncbi:MAG: energy transducer TonB [Flavobacteriaceae bacterium]